MLRNKALIYVLLLNFLFLSLKWMMSFYESDMTLLTSILINTKDIQYYPLIVSLSEFNFSQTFLEYYSDAKIMPVPLASLAVHSIFFKLFNIYSFIILEYIFHSLLIFILFNIIKKIFNSSNVAALFCVLVYIIILSLKVITNFVEPQIFYKLYAILIENFGTRTPRPLVTSVFYFSFIYYVMFFEDKIKNGPDYTYVLKLAIFLGLLANSFIFLFIHCFVFLLIFLFKSLGEKLIEWVKFNYKFLFYFTLLLIIFLLPILFQNLYSENDFNSRAGVVSIGLEKKLFLIKYYLVNLLRLEFLILFSLTLVLNWFINKNSLQTFNTDKINIFFLLVISSILSPLIFFIFSPKIISIFHFLNIMIFSFIFYIILSLFYILYFSLKKFDIQNYHLKKTPYIVLSVICVFIFFSLELNSFLKNKNQRIEINELNKFFIRNNLQNTNLKLFTNDLLTLNLWLLNGNTQLVISDALTNSLSDSRIEFNLLNTLKDFDIGEKQLKELISFKKSQIRNELFNMLFSYKFQANSLYTYSLIENYNKIDQGLIIKTSPFRVQMQIIPETEKERIINLYKNLKIKVDLLPNYVVLNISNSLENFNIKNNKYKKIFKTENFLIYKRL